MNVILRTADQLHKAELGLDQSYTSADIIQAGVDNWKLPSDTDYSLMNVTKNAMIPPIVNILTAGVQEGDTLEIQPILVAG